MPTSYSTPQHRIISGRRVPYEVGTIAPYMWGGGRRVPYEVGTIAPY